MFRALVANAAPLLAVAVPFCHESHVCGQSPVCGPDAALEVADFRNFITRNVFRAAKAAVVTQTPTPQKQPAVSSTKRESTGAGRKPGLAETAHKRNLNTNYHAVLTQTQTPQQQQQQQQQNFPAVLTQTRTPQNQPSAPSKRGESTDAGPKPRSAETVRRSPLTLKCLTAPVEGAERRSSGPAKGTKQSPSSASPLLQKARFFAPQRLFFHPGALTSEAVRNALVDAQPGDGVYVAYIDPKFQKRAGVKAEEIGTLIESFEAVDTLGYGGEAVVLELQSSLIKEPLVLRAESRGGREISGSVLVADNFCEGTADLADSPLVLPYLIFETEEFSFSVMPFCRGGDLWNRVEPPPDADGVFFEPKPLPEADVVVVARDVVRALKTLHDAGLAHFDVKPANILCRGDTIQEGCVLADLGHAAKLPPPGKPKLAGQRGTPAFGAPELMAAAAYDEKSDMWSLGATLVYLLSAELPYGIFNIPAKIAKGELTDSFKYVVLSKNGRDFIEKLLIVEPEKRMTAEEALRHPWLNETPVKQP